jgi:hypothetical protein
MQGLSDASTLATTSGRQHPRRLRQDGEALPTNRAMHQDRHAPRMVRRLAASACPGQPGAERMSYFVTVTLVHVVFPPDVTHVIFSSTFTPSTRTVTILSSCALASVQYPFASTFVHTSVWPGGAGCAMTKLENRPIAAKAMPSVFLRVCRTCRLLLMWLSLPALDCAGLWLQQANCMPPLFRPALVCPERTLTESR